jgi:hypothetical protein
MSFFFLHKITIYINRKHILSAPHHQIPSCHLLSYLRNQNRTSKSLLLSTKSYNIQKHEKLTTMLLVLLEILIDSNLLVMNGGEYVNVSILRKRKPHKINETQFGNQYPEKLSVVKVSLSEPTIRC